MYFVTQTQKACVLCTRCWVWLDGHVFYTCIETKPRTSGRLSKWRWRGSALEDDQSWGGRTRSRETWKRGVSRRNGPLIMRNGEVCARPATLHREPAAKGKKEKVRNTTYCTSCMVYNVCHVFCTVYNWCCTLYGMHVVHCVPYILLYVMHDKLYTIYHACYTVCHASHTMYVTLVVHCTSCMLHILCTSIILLEHLTNLSSLLQPDVSDVCLVVRYGHSVTHTQHT